MSSVPTDKASAPSTCGGASIETPSAAASSPGLPPAPFRATATGEDLLSALKSLAEVAAVFTAVTYVGGWSYLASYYKCFGLNPLDLDAPASVVSTIAIHMLFDSVWPLVVAVIVFASIHYFLGSHRASRTMAAGAITCLLFASALAGILRGRQLANEDMFETSGTLPTIGFMTKDKYPEPSCLGYLTYETVDCRLLLHSRNMYYLFKPVRLSARGTTSKGNINLFIVPDSEVIGVHIRRGVQ